MNDRSQGLLLTSTAADVKTDEFLKIVNIGDQIKHSDNSVSTVTRKTYIEQISGDYKIEVASQRP